MTDRLQNAKAASAAGAEEADQVEIFVVQWKQEVRLGMRELRPGGSLTFIPAENSPKSALTMVWGENGTPFVGHEHEKTTKVVMNKPFTIAASANGFYPFSLEKQAGGDYVISVSDLGVEAFSYRVYLATDIWKLRCLASLVTEDPMVHFHTEGDVPEVVIDEVSPQKQEAVRITKRNTDWQPAVNEKEKVAVVIKAHAQLAVSSYAGNIENGNQTIGGEEAEIIIEPPDPRPGT